MQTSRRAGTKRIIAKIKGHNMKIYIKTYGIACVEEIDGRREIITAVHDVTTDPDKADTLVNILNNNQLAPEHIRDVIEDCLTTN